MKSNERYERGLNKLAEIDGPQGQKVIESLADIAPDFARYLIEFHLETSTAARGLTFALVN